MKVNPHAINHNPNPYKKAALSDKEAKSAPNADAKKLDKGQQASKSDKLELSEKSKDLAKKLVSMPGLPPVAPLGSPVSEAAEETPPVLETSKPTKPEPIKELEVLKQERNNMHKPATIFIGGLQWFSLGSDYSGVKNMADSIKDAKYFDWNDSKAILEEIKKRDPAQPVILVGHSFGGDTAMKVAQKLNTLEYGFRKVDLLVTIDAVGSSKDIIPQNVVKNLNFFGEKNLFLNDGPHVARDVDMTEIINELRPEDHTDLDDSNEVQFKIVRSINDELAKFQKLKNPVNEPSFS